MRGPPHYAPVSGANIDNSIFLLFSLVTDKLVSVAGLPWRKSSCDSIASICTISCQKTKSTPPLMFLPLFVVFLPCFVF